VKRVIALPGERLKITHGNVFINGRQLREPYLPADLKSDDWPVDGSDPNGQLIPAGHYFVMGDNRNHSSDSRVFGAIALNQIESRAWIRLLPLDKFGPVVERPTVQATATAIADRRRAA